MIATYAIAILILVWSFVVGQAIHAAAGWRTGSSLVSVTGFAALLVLSAAAIRLPGHDVTAAALAAFVLVACAVGARRHLVGPGAVQLALTVAFLVAASPRCARGPSSGRRPRGSFPTERAPARIRSAMRPPSGG